MCGEREDGVDRFRPCGASSPLLGTLDESDLPSSVDLESSAESRPKILSPREDALRRRSVGCGARRKSGDAAKFGAKKSLRKISDELGSALPSRSGTILYFVLYYILYFYPLQCYILSLHSPSEFV
jgi:hypothetical protein